VSAGSKPIDEVLIYFASPMEKALWAELLKQTSLRRPSTSADIPLLTPNYAKTKANQTLSDRMAVVVVRTSQPRTNATWRLTLMLVIDWREDSESTQVLSVPIFGTPLDMVLACDFVLTGHSQAIPRFVQIATNHLITYGV
jgi:hypothetical protein